MKLQRFSYVPLAFSLFTLPSLSSASTDICPVDSYVIGFFNKVEDTHKLISMKSLCCRNLAQ